MWKRLEAREIKRVVRRRDSNGTSRSLPRPELPPGTDLMPDIQHIVVLMMENHSFDNYLGMLAGRGEAFALNPAGKPAAVNLRTNGDPVTARHAAATVQAEHVPTQSWHATHIQWNDGGCDGFVRSIEVTEPTFDATTPMEYWSEADLPFYYGLARTFPLADHWFCSCLGPTFPNRRFLIAGTAHGLIDDLPFGMVDHAPAGTIFDMLTEHDISWINYHNVSKVKTVLKRTLGTPGLIMLRRAVSVLRWFPPLIKAFQGNMSFTADLYPLGLARCVLHLRGTDQFLTRRTSAWGRASPRRWSTGSCTARAGRTPC